VGLRGLGWVFFILVVAWGAWRTFPRLSLRFFFCGLDARTRARLLLAYLGFPWYVPIAVLDVGRLHHCNLAVRPPPDKSDEGAFPR
jgi:hypothetical protein